MAKKKVVFKAGGMAAKAADKASGGGAAGGGGDAPAAPAAPAGDDSGKPKKKKVVFKAGGMADQAAKKVTAAAIPKPAATAAAPVKAAPAATAATGGSAAVAATPSGPAVAAAAALARKKGGPKKPVAKKAPTKPVEPLPIPAALQTRRSFIEWGIVAWAVFFAWLGLVGHLFLRFMFPRVLYEADPKFRAGKKSDFPEIDKVYEIYKETKGVWLVRLMEQGEDRLVAISTICTHLGCTPNWLQAEQKFKCPCHGSGFYKEGVNFEGPAPRPLERYRLYVDATGDVVVDRAKKFRDDLGEWNKAGSFVQMS